MLRSCRLLLAALLVAAAPLRAAAQAPDTTATTATLFTARDAWIAGGFAAATVALAPLDRAIAEGAQDSLLQANRVLRQGAGVSRWLGFPGSVLVTGGIYALGVAVDVPELADVGLHSTEAILLAEAITVTAKALVGRARPRLDMSEPFDMKPGRGIRHDDFQSFPSGHSTAAFAAAAALTTEVAERWPRRKLLAGVVLYSGASLVAVSRLYHNEHWASDVLVGAAIGSFSGWKVIGYHHAHPGSRLDGWLLPRAVPTGPGELTLIWTVPVQ